MTHHKLLADNCRRIPTHRNPHHHKQKDRMRMASGLSMFSPSLVYSLLSTLDFLLLTDAGFAKLSH